jgi:cation-dependent mannose-6-phosphate receptor
MHLPRSSSLLTLLAASMGISLAAESTKTTTASAPACTASLGGAFYDLRPDMAVAPEEGKAHKAAATTDYHARGYDYGRNFTLNICGAVVEPPTKVVGLDSKAYKNISAYYTYKGEVYSLGLVSPSPTRKISEAPLTSGK